MMLTHGSKAEIKELLKTAELNYIDTTFVTAEFYSSGQLLMHPEIRPTQRDTDTIDFSIYEVEQGTLATESGWFRQIDTIDKIELNRISLNNFYVDHKFDVFPLNAVHKHFRLGNIKHDLDHLIRVITVVSARPQIVTQLSREKLSSLLRRYGDVNGKELHTAQSLLEKYKSIKYFD